MTERIVLRTLGDLCLYFGVVGAFPLFFTHDFMLLYPALLCAAGAGAAAELSRKWPGPARYTALLLPLSSLLLADAPMEFLLLAPALLYTALVIRRDLYDLDYYEFREQFLSAGRMLCVFAGVICALGYFEGMYGTSWKSYDISAVVLYGVIYGLTGVFLLRQVRMGPDSHPQDRLANNVQMTVVIAAVLGLALLAVALEESARDLISWVMYAFMVVMGTIPIIIQEIIYWFLNHDGGLYLEEITPATTLLQETVFPTYINYSGEPPAPPTEAGFPWWLAVLILTVLCAGMLFLLQSMRAGSGTGSAGGYTEAELPEKKRRQSRRSNRSKVRRLYRSYLKLVQRSGQRLETYQTTADILEQHPQNTNTEAAAALRKVYLKARYDPFHPVTDLEVDQAKAALKRVTDYHNTK